MKYAKEEEKEIKKYEEYYTKLYSRIAGIALTSFSVVKILILRSYWDTFGEDAIFDLGLWCFMAILGLTLIFPSLQKEYYFSKADKKRRQPIWSKMWNFSSMKLIYWYIGLSGLIVVYTLMSWNTIDGDPYSTMKGGLISFALGLFVLWSHSDDKKTVKVTTKSTQ